MNPAGNKRRKELERKEHQQHKAEKKEQRKREKEDRSKGLPPGVDPDIADIVPGPQPIPEE